MRKIKLIATFLAIPLLYQGLFGENIVKTEEYKQKRIEQYKQFYEEYIDFDYDIEQIGTTHEISKDESVSFPLYSIKYTHNNNLHDNSRKDIIQKVELYVNQKRNKEFLDYFDYNGPASSWYRIISTTYLPKHDTFIIPLEELSEELPQIIKDVLTLPKELQKKIHAIWYYPVDKDSEIYFQEELEKNKELIEKVYNHVKKLDGLRDSKKSKNLEEKIQPIKTTKNQLLPFDPFSGTPYRLIDMDGDGKAEFLVEMYSLNGDYFNPNPRLQVSKVELLKWFKLDENGKRKNEKPYMIDIDFDSKKENEKEGMDIRFCDKDFDGEFESYEILQAKEKQIEAILI